MGLREHNPYIMKNNNLIRFAQSLVLLPAMTMSFTGGGINTNQIAQNILVQKVNIEANGTSGFLSLNQATDPKVGPKVQILQAEADAIDAYFAKYDMPLEGTGAKMAEEADANDLDWRLLPAISVRESTGGKHECTSVSNNPFGWGSCKIGFKTNAAAIETIAKNLGGNNPSTAVHYDDKTTLEILHAYNPPSVVPRYAEQVMKIMSAIGPEDITTLTPATT